ncbi:MAG: Rrf2 family transcriptional regulator [Anaerolineaceae bacterium]|nr:Rrf2 family transcriptional regulator [Anaerolineaceae bacterium]
MFKVSRRLDYGLQLMITLAADEENKPQPTARLAADLHIPLPFLHQIGHSLMQAGLIKATPGPKGGLKLNLPAKEISTLMVTEALEGPIALNNCEGCLQPCDDQANCVIKPFWDNLQQNIVDYMSAIKLPMLINGTIKIPVYHINGTSE